MIQKHFMDISRVKFGDEITSSNVDGFEVGDIIQITEKWDGSNASIRYDKETGKLVAFSRKYELAFDRTLSGFWNFVQTQGAIIGGDMPATSKEAIGRIFDGGITFWHNGDQIGNYAQATSSGSIDNPIV